MFNTNFTKLQVLILLKWKNFFFNLNYNNDESCMLMKICMLIKHRLGNIKAWKYKTLDNITFN